MEKLSGKRFIALLLVIVMSTALLAGCKGNSAETAESQSDTNESQEETGAVKSQNEPIDPDAIVTTIGGVDITAADLFFTYANYKMTYESYQTIDWNTVSSDDLTWGEEFKEEIESRIYNLAYLLSFKDQYEDIEITEDEHAEAADMATQFLEMLSAEDIALYGFTEENLIRAMENYLLASSLYTAEEERIAAELTDEEKAACTYRTVQHILIATEMPEETDESGETITKTDEEIAAYKDERKARAEEVLAKAQAGEDFATLAEEYTDDSGLEYSFNAEGQTVSGTSFVEEFVVGANALAEGEISGLVETEYGYHIIKCISTDDAEVRKEAESEAAYNKFWTVYEEWLTANETEFYQLWQDFIVENAPEVEAETTDETTSDTTGSSTEDTETTAESGE